MSQSTGDSNSSATVQQALKESHSPSLTTAAAEKPLPKPDFIRKAGLQRPLAALSELSIHASLACYAEGAAAAGAAAAAGSGAVAGAAGGMLASCGYLASICRRKGSSEGKGREETLVEAARAGALVAAAAGARMRAKRLMSTQQVMEEHAQSHQGRCRQQRQWQRGHWREQQAALVWHCYLLAARQQYQH